MITGGQFSVVIYKGTIKSGSYLILESLDRLSRGAITNANPLFLKILKKGITIVTLIDKKTYSKESINDNPMDLMYSIMQQSLAHEESRKKSDRANANWSKKKKAILDSKTPYSAKVPNWIALKKGEYKLIPERAKIIRLIFDLALAGKGRTAITTYLNENNIKYWSTYGLKKKGITKNEKHWSRASVQKILISKASYGSLETVQVEEVKGYFPAVITEADYLKVVQIRSEKRIAVGSSNKTLPNLFAGLAVCGKCGSRMHYLNKGKGNRYLVCSKALDKGQCDYNSWQYAFTEKHIIYSLREMDYKAVFSKQNHDFSGEIVLLEDRKKQLEKSLETKAQLLFRDDVTPIFMDKVVAESAKLEEELNHIKVDLQKLEHAAILAKEDIPLDKLGELFDSTKDGTLDKRLAVNQLLKASIEKITFIPIKEKSHYSGAFGDFIHSKVEIFFKNTEKSRTIMIFSERVKYSELQDKSSSFITDAAGDHLDTNIVISGDKVDRYKVGVAVTHGGKGMDFFVENETGSVSKNLH